jgi:hypothetical protein
VRVNRSRGPEMADIPGPILSLRKFGVRRPDAAFLHNLNMKDFGDTVCLLSTQSGVKPPHSKSLVAIRRIDAVEFTQESGPRQLP